MAKMISAIILGAGYGTRLEAELVNLPNDDPFKKQVGKPKPLLPVIFPTENQSRSLTLLDLWMNELQNSHCTPKSQDHVRQVFLVVNDLHLGQYKKWAEENQFPLENIISDGTTTNESRVGAVGCLDLVLKKKEKEIGTDDILVIAGDTFFYNDFYLSNFLATRERGGDTILYYELSNPSEVSKRGIIEIDHNKRVQDLLEKPDPSITASRLACPAFYYLRNESLKFVGEFLEETKGRPLVERDAPGLFISYLIKKSHVFAQQVKGRFDIGNLKDYKETIHSLSGTIFQRAYARVGFVGNPSDGFNGKTISFSLSNYFAQVRIWESVHLEILLNPVFDSIKFASIDDLINRTKISGYYGGYRLLRATIKRFGELAKKGGHHLKKNFTISYTSNIPFAVGLAGSSAIVTATFKALMDFYKLPLEALGLNLSQLPNVILAIEREELGITAGLQDRVIQSFEGLVSMDFSKEVMDSQGYGNYERLKIQNLPPLYLAYQVKEGEESGKIHSDVRKRWEAGETFIIEGIKEFIKFADQGKVAIENQDFDKLAELLDNSFNQRRKIYTDQVLGKENIKMVNLARDCGFSAAFTGSGGAIVCLLKNNKEQDNKRRKVENGNKDYHQRELNEEEEEEVKKRFENEGFIFEKIRIKENDVEPTFIW